LPPHIKVAGLDEIERLDMTTRGYMALLNHKNSNIFLIVETIISFIPRYLKQGSELI